VSAADLQRIAWVLLAFFGVATLVLLSGPYLTRSSREQLRAMRTRLEQIREERSEVRLLRLESREMGLQGAWQTLLGARLAAWLVTLHLRAGESTQPDRLLWRSLGFALLSASAGWWVAGAAGALGFGILGGSLPTLLMVITARRRSRRFAAQFGQVLEFLARSMRSGLDLPGSMRSVCEEFTDPVAGEFRRAVDEINYGVPVDLALLRIRDRVSCSDIGYLAASVAIQRETGGGLAQSLETLARTIRERHVFEAKVRTLSAQGKLSATILCLLPIVVLAVMSVTNQSYIGVLFDTPAGNQVLAAASALIVIGVLWVSTVIRLRV